MSMFWSQWAGDYYNADTVKWLIKDWKIELLRVTMGVNQGGYLENKDKEKQKVITTVDAAIAGGIYVIIDWHIEGQNSQNLEAAKEFFSEMSQRYSNKDHV